MTSEECKQFADYAARTAGAFVILGETIAASRKATAEMAASFGRLMETPAFRVMMKREAGRLRYQRAYLRRGKGRR